MSTKRDFPEPICSSNNSWYFIEHGKNPTKTFCIQPSPDREPQSYLNKLFPLGRLTKSPRCVLVYLSFPCFRTSESPYCSPKPPSGCVTKGTSKERTYQTPILLLAFNTVVHLQVLKFALKLRGYFQWCVPHIHPMPEKEPRRSISNQFSRWSGGRGPLKIPKH